MKKNKIWFLLTLFLGCVFLSSCTEQMAKDMEKNIIDALIPNFWAFLTQFLSLIMMIILVYIFAYKPLRNYMDKRAEYLQNEIKDTNKNNALSKLNLEESEEKIAEAKKESLKIINDAKLSANIEKSNILKSANEEAANIITKAKDDIKHEELKAKNKIRKTIIDVAMDASSYLLEREVNNKDNEKLLEDFVDKMNQESKE